MVSMLNKCDKNDLLGGFKKFDRPLFLKKIRSQDLKEEIISPPHVRTCVEQRSNLGKNPLSELYGWHFKYWYDYYSTHLFYRYIFKLNQKIY